MKGKLKIIVIGIGMLVILSSFSVAEMNNIQRINQKKKVISSDSSIDSSTDVSIVYEFHMPKKSKFGLMTDYSCKSNNIHNDNKIVFEKNIDLSESELGKILMEIESLWNKFYENNCLEEKMDIFKNILEIERENGFLPPSFTVENINRTGKILCKLFRNNLKKEKIFNQNNTDSNIKTNDLLDFGEPFIGFGSAACIVAPYAQVLPLPLGIFLFEVESYELPIFEHASVDFVVTIGAAWMELLISHAAAGLGWAISFMPPNAYAWIGPFYSMWGLNAGISLTIYLTSGPNSVSLLDLCVWGGATNIILPFSIN